jgi:cytochrome P450
MTSLNAHNDGDRRPAANGHGEGDVTPAQEHARPVDVDHNDRAFVADPYPIYAALRRDDPVHHSAAYGGYYLVTRYDDVRRALGDWQTFSSAKPGVTSIPLSVKRDFPEIPLEVDPPEHRQYRALVTPWFSRRRVDSLEGRVRQLVSELLDRIEGERRVDFVQQLAVPLVARALALFLNLPVSESEPWAQWMSDIFHGRLADRERADAAGRKLIGFVDGKIAAAKEQPEADFFGMLAEAEYDGRRLTDKEMRGYGVLTMTAGQETTVNGIGNSIWYLGCHAEQREQLLRDPSLIPAAVEELLRYLSPIQLLGRSTTQDANVSGRLIPQGSTVAICYGAANRDERAFEEADQCLIERPRNRHVAFGSGPHACLGAHLARLEMRVAIGEVLRRMPDYELETDKIEMTPHGDLRGPWRLPAIIPQASKE